MLSTQHTQSLSDFRENTTETIERLNQNGEAEVLTVNGEPRVVLLSPAAYDDLAQEAQLAHDASVICRSIQQLNEGKYLEASAFFDGVRSQLLILLDRREDGLRGVPDSAIREIVTVG
jgi:prevent-host-death family protein